MPPRQVPTGKHFAFCVKRRGRACHEHPSEITMEPFIVARCDRILRRADVDMVNQQVFGSEMRIENHGQKNVSKPPFKSIFLVQ